MHAEDENGPDVEEQDAIDKATQQRYRVWKKNCPFMYDYVSTHSLLWPSLTVQFFPDLESSQVENVKDPQSQLVSQRLLLGTFTLGQGTDSVSIWQLPYYRDLNQCITVDSLNYNADKQEFELPAVSKNKLRNIQSINHWGDVNKLRYMSQNPDVIASSNNMGDLIVYNRTKHSNIKILGNENEINEPQLRLVNKAKPFGGDIFAFDWNKQTEGVITSGCMDGTINLHDIKSGFTNKDVTAIDVTRYYETGDAINDIEWLPNHNSLFLAAGDSGKLGLFDTRSESSNAVATYNSGAACNSISVSTNGITLASGHSDGSVNIYDIRALNTDVGSLLKLNPHSDAVTQVRWHPKFASVLGSSSTDRSVKLHDLGRSENNNGLLFSHEGHMLGVNDFDWSLHEDWMVASVADDNSLHVWKPAEKVLHSL
ncbi:hypothetical protein FT663_03267 [Candidozyma haemuli var. vulneris]|uniref:Histone-binding protein RBBP4-like N-terminal domain-containing protein n=1 Tax=Candidozyma haemuli TaxID=45357 RepID=A0A2V1AMQ1_9ASCO|nr:hypothetical protein CXQ85_003189 [[Candida] haemuloni]KAF3990223.1 hypothetical protein FT663_03267 [[Candida] haemuloni var. vulneris]KAF3990516.1 hypothetical protein FT662_02201 [[Candida] haemuloni var. vulneris]PVH19350.1 hypothetical protein CXQ85_003189 [[Candida] haemuloni]